MQGQPVRSHSFIAIVGAGFSGLGMAIRLKQEGYTDVVVFEKAATVGGTWRDNTYPGCGCDVESVLYSYSFAPNIRWSRKFSPQPEIKAYLEACADDFGVRDLIRFGHEVKKLEWLEGEAHWRLETNRGTFTAQHVVAAAGPLSEPAIPQLKGIETFLGRAFHSAQWDHTCDLRGRRVAVIGTGASAIQFVPVIQQEVAHLSLFQRTPPWVTPRFDRPLTAREHQLLAASPLVHKAWRAYYYLLHETFVPILRRPRLMRVMERLVRLHMTKVIRDPKLRAKLMPDYRMGCKRVLISNTYYPALTKPNVEVVTARVREVVPDGLVTADGVKHGVDTIIYGTGFHVTDPAWAGSVLGRGGKSLAEVWQGSPQAYAGTVVHGFPNLSILLGPHTGLGHTSVIMMAEAQMEHVLGGLRHLSGSGEQILEVKDSAQARFVAGVERAAAGTVWSAGGCQSWYIDATGKTSTLWPLSVAAFRRQVVAFKAADYEVRSKKAVARSAKISVVA